jgi:ABC-2 type transport system permease protein
MFRLFRLWAYFGYMDLQWMLRDLGSFVGYVFSDVMGIMAAISAMVLLAERFDGLGPWSRPHVWFLLGYAVMVHGALDTVFGYNISNISRRIGRGQLDHVLVQPQPLWLTLLTEGFSPAAGLPIFFTGLALFAFGVFTSGITLAPTWLVLFLVNFAASCAILLAFNYAIGSIAFWAPRSAEEINSSSWRLMGQLRTFPLDGVGRGLLVGLMTLVPAGFIAWLPSRALLGLDPSPLTLWLTPTAALIFATIALAIFRTGLTHYRHTGSQRYLSYGHRR